MVLSPEQTLPSPSELVTPAGVGSALSGIPVPLCKEVQRARELIDQPMCSGDYAFVGREFTVLGRVSPLGTGDAYPGHDLPADAARGIGIGLAERDRMERSVWMVVLEFLEVQGGTGEAVLFMTKLADRLAELVGGTILDWEALRGYLPGAWRMEEGLRPLDAREHIVIHATTTDDGANWIHTHGLAKFGRPELEVFDVPETLASTAHNMMWNLCQYVAVGAIIQPGETVGDPQVPLCVRLGRNEIPEHYVVPCLELVDMGRDGKPEKRGAARGIMAWASA